MQPRIFASKASRRATVRTVSHLLPFLIPLFFSAIAARALDNKIYWSNKYDGTGVQWILSNGSYQSSGALYGQNPYPTIQICIGTGDFDLTGDLDFILQERAAPLR